MKHVDEKDYIIQIYSSLTQINSVLKQNYQRSVLQ